MKNKANWISQKTQIDLIKPTIQIERNPYYQKWGKGRPTKQMLKQRDLWTNWELKNNPLLNLMSNIKEISLNYKHKEKSFLI
jgi:hypothetical protein